MTEPPDAWSATDTVRVETEEEDDRLVRSLGPEASREVPRTRAEVRRTGERTLELAMEARDSGALRAALNTYLGWIHLALATAEAAGPRSRSRA